MPAIWGLAVGHAFLVAGANGFEAAYDFLLSKRGPFAGINILNRLYYDTALAVNPYVLRSLQEVVDSSHIVFGTDYVWAQSWMTPLFVKALREYDGFDE